MVGADVEGVTRLGVLADRVDGLGGEAPREGFPAVAEVSGAESAYVPARPIDSISCYDILHAMRAGQGSDVTSQDGPLQQQILGEFLRINEAERMAAEKVTVLAMADRANTLLGPAPAGHKGLTDGTT